MAPIPPTITGSEQMAQPLHLITSSAVVLAKRAARLATTVVTIAHQPTMRKKQGRQPGYRLAIVPSGSQHATLFNPWVDRRIDDGISIRDAAKPTWADMDMVMDMVAMTVQWPSESVGAWLARSWVLGVGDLE
ncbi:hypothetical protein LA080_004247 [Diaporthe eres]|nr:hypothetical protein LA080_004247 [Diaporthe eres]